MTVVSRPAMSDDGGTFTTGTVVDKTFIDDLLDEVDDQCHSATNPTIKPKTITDEVVAARGSKASLDARLDISLEEDGTLKSQASLVTAAQLQSALGSRNVVANGDLADWTAGGAAAPDNFTLTGAGATIARTGPAMADTFTFGTGGGGFAAKVTRVGNDWKLTQDVIATADFANFINVKSQKFSVAVKGKTAIASLLRIVVDDGVSTTASSYHTGGGAEEHLSVTHTISNSATKLSVYVEGTGSNGDAYVGGFTFVFANLAPTDWQPLSVIGDANATSKGLVTTAAQTLAGAKTLTGALVNSSSTAATFAKPPTFNPGNAATPIRVKGKITFDVTQRAGINGTNDLTSYSLEAATLAAAGDAIRITAWGRVAANANSKRVFLDFGATTIDDTTASASWNGYNWKLVAVVMFKDATNQRASGEWFMAANAGTGGNHATIETKPTETAANAITVRTRATGAAASDVLQEGFMIEWL